MKAICFDLDGTLARFQGDFELFLDSYRVDLGLVQCDFNSFARELSSRLRGSGRVTLQGATLDAFSKLEQRVPADLTEVVNGALGEYSAQVVLMPGAKEVLEFASQRLPLALISNGPSDMQRAALRSLGIESYFTTIVVSGDEDLAVRKPNPRIFELACQRLNTAPEHVLMVGDNLVADIQGALAAGLQAVWLGTNGSEDVDKVGNLQELHSYLEQKLL